MSERPGRQPSERAQRRLFQRIRHPALWSDAEVHALERLYWRHPKWWWHVQRVVQQQVQVGQLACTLGLAHLVSSPILDDLAFDPDPDILADALKVALKTARASGQSQAWTSLQAVLLALLRAEEPPKEQEVEPIPIALDAAFTPLTTWPALRAEGRAMNSCIGQLTWWRKTVMMQGMGYAVRRGASRATVWLVPNLAADGSLLEVRDALGPQNRPLDDELRAWIDRCVEEAHVLPPAATSPEGTPELGKWGVRPDEEHPSQLERYTAIEALAERLSPRAEMIPPPARHGVPHDAMRVHGLRPAHWVRHYQMFAEPYVWRRGADVPSTSKSHTARIEWDDQQDALIAETPEGTWTLRAGLPLQLEGPANASVETSFLWMEVPGCDPDTDLPKEADQARLRFLASLPEWLTSACSEVDALRGMEGIWLLSQAPDLASLLLRYPAIAQAVRDKACANEATLPALTTRLDTAEPLSALLAVLDWLGLPNQALVANEMDRLHEDAWCLESLEALSRAVAAGPETRRVMDRVHPLHPVHAVLLDTAIRTGLESCLTAQLLMDALTPVIGCFVSDRLSAVFAELEASVHATGRKVPRFTSMGHLARVWVQRHQPARRGLEVVELPGPWGPAACSLHEVESLASDVGCDAQVWRSAASRGLLVFSGVPLNVPTVTWLRPAGLRGHLRLAATHTLHGEAAPLAVRELIEAHLIDHNHRVAQLPPGWTERDAEAVHLPPALAAVSGAGRYPLGSLVRMLMDLRG